MQLGSTSMTRTQGIIIFMYNTFVDETLCLYCHWKNLQCCVMVGVLVSGAVRSWAGAGFPIKPSTSKLYLLLIMQH